MTYELTLAIACGCGVLLAFLAGRWSVRWTDTEPKPVVAVDAQESPLEARARVLTADAEAGPGGGEYRRHVVYARLIKEFPSASKRAVSLAIEKGLPL